MPDKPIDPAELVDQLSALVGLPIQPEHHASVVENFSRIMAVAQLVREFPLPEDVEIATVFEP